MIDVGVAGHDSCHLPSRPFSGGLGLSCAVVAFVSVFSTLIRFFTWGNLFTLTVVVTWGLFGLMYVVRSRVRLSVTADGVEQLGFGGWRLSWHEIQAVGITDSELVIKPTERALCRNRIRDTAWWSRMFTAGRHERRVIIFSRPSIDASAMQHLLVHNARYIPPDPGSSAEEGKS